jgi:formylglycine-generating enzyme required for sulfatase activity
VVSVSWYEAAAYCAWLSERLGRAVRLPTEAEWERAARGTSGRKYPWGSDAPDVTRANYDFKVGHTTPVGLYPLGATPEGIHDLAGNAWEWVSDWYAPNYFVTRSSQNPKGPSSGRYRVLRGGSWVPNPRNVRVSRRLRNYPSSRYDDNGFRCGGEVDSP